MAEKSKHHPNSDIPKLGAKIEYAVKFNDVNVATYGEYSKTVNFEMNGIGLSDGRNWDDVLIWSYIDEDYDYGEVISK